MTDSSLTAFWIQSPIKHAPPGFGVTANSLEDAVRIIHALDYGRFLPSDAAYLQVVQPVTILELDQDEVVRRMGPINVRGMWYPFVVVGVPHWAAERLIAHDSATRRM